MHKLAAYIAKYCAKKIEAEIRLTTEKIIKELGVTDKAKEPLPAILRESQHETLVQKFGSSRALSELYLRLSSWPHFVAEWGDSPSFA